MPPLTRWYIKASLVYLMAALLAGALVAGRGPLGLPASLAALAPVYVHLFMVGWATQLIFGVAYWMFPKYSRESPRGHESLAWATFALLNEGLILRAVGEPLNALQPEQIWGWLLVVSAVSQWLAGLGFVVNLWPRVKER
jgi:hypothetical protein